MSSSENFFISSPNEIREIPDRSSRVAASIIYTLYPGKITRIGYQTEQFFHRPHIGKIEGTVPDLNVEFEKEDKLRVEATHSNSKWCVQSLQSLPIWLNNTDVVKNENGGIELLGMLIKHDPKSRQKRVMKNVAPDERYEVWDGKYLSVLRKIAKRKRSGKAIGNVAI